MSVFLVPDFTQPTFAPVAYRRISQSESSTTSTNGRPNSATALMRLRNFSPTTGYGRAGPRASVSSLPPML